MECPYHEGTNSLPAVVARLLPNSTYGWVPWYAAYERDALGRTTNVTATYSTGYDVWPLTRTRQYVYNGLDLATVIGPQGEILAGYGYTNHLVIRATNAVGDVTLYTWDPQERLTSVKTPAGLTRTNLYFASGTYTNFVQTAIDLEISRTNSFTYTNDLVSTHTDERGLTTTSLYDNLNRLTNSANSLGAISYVYDKLDLVREVDRLGFATSFAYDALRRRTAETNALGRATLYTYCTCGSLDWIEDAAGNYTHFTYDDAGRLLTAVYPDNYGVTNQYDLLGEVVITTDSAGVSVTNLFDNQGQLYATYDAGGQRSALAFDVEDRATNTWDVNSLSIGMVYDNLGRLLSRTYPDGGAEEFGYSAHGLVAYTNQLGYATHYAYDPARAQDRRDECQPPGHGVQLQCRRRSAHADRRQKPDHHLALRPVWARYQQTGSGRQRHPHVRLRF
jgi:YD repeat-containing protein